jgi:hypothetical protein
LKTLIVDWIADQERAISVLEEQLNNEWIAEIMKDDEGKEEKESQTGLKN